MKKLFFMFVAIMMVITATAQQTNFVGSSKFTDNWSLGITSGVQSNLNSWNTPQGAVIGIELDKQITPLVGFTFGLNTGINNRMNWFKNGSHMHNALLIDQLAGVVDVRFNAMNAFWGYTGKPRFFEVEGLVGVGYGRGMAEQYTRVPKLGAILGKTGVNFNFNVDKAKAWTITIRPAVIWNTSGSNKFDSKFAVAQLTAGAVYHFTNSNKKHYAETPIPVVVEKEKVVEKVIEKIVEKEKVVEKIVTRANDYYITIAFDKGSAEIKSDVAPLAAEINKTTDTYKISGFTSPEGSEQVNKELGLARAKALKDALVKAGVDKKRLEIDNSYESLRTAVIMKK